MALEAIHLEAVEQDSGARGRLLAVRRAGAAFDGPFLFRSPAFEGLLEERATLCAEEAVARQVLLDALHRAVPLAGDRSLRRELLEVKRRVFNGRRPAAIPAAAPPEVREAMARHGALLDREDALFSGRAEQVRDEVNAWVARVLADERFRLACRHASPDLFEALERGSGARDGFAAETVRTVYAYAARYVAKANPLHLFASVCLPGAGAPAGGAHEVVLDVGEILALERELLPHAADARRVWLALRPFVRDGEKLCFWVPSGEGSLSVVSLRDGPLMAEVIAFFQEQRRTGRPVGTRAACEEHLRARLPAAAPEAVAGLLDFLLRRDIVAAYLVTDPDAAARSLDGLGDGAAAARVRTLGRLHLAVLAPAELAAASSALERAGPGGAPARYFVNTLDGDGGAERHHAAAEAVRPALAELKPCFAMAHNFSGNGYVIRAFLAEFAAERGGSVPYLDALQHFLRHREEVVGCFRAETHRPASERGLATAWLADAAARTGVLERSEVEALGALPRALGHVPRSLCFNGPLDYAAGTYHLSNVFAGDGRFAGRYLLRRGRVAPARPREDGDVLDVEVAVPPPPNLHYVLRSYPAGCGFESRWSHRYERWIEPAEVVVETVAGGGVGYRHAPTGTPLRFHYRGFLLAHLLPGPYQLLLANHGGDAFLNPFEGVTDAPGNGESRYRPGLRYGPVQLRRERWEVPAAVLADPLGHVDPLRAAALLRDRVHGLTDRDLDHWYVRAPGEGASGHKPRFLDLRTPLAAGVLRRMLAPLPAGAVVAISPMAPGREGLFRHGAESFVTELMIEA